MVDELLWKIVMKVTSRRELIENYRAAVVALSQRVNSINGLRGLDLEIAACELAAAQINYERAKLALAAFGETRF
jgi:hypothetical protein